MSSMTEEIEISDRKVYRLLPKSKIPVFDTWYIGTYKGEYSEENKYNALIDMSFEFAQKTVILICSHYMIFKNGTNLEQFNTIRTKKSFYLAGRRLKSSFTGKSPIRLFRTYVSGLYVTSSSTISSDCRCT